MLIVLSQAYMHPEAAAIIVGVFYAAVIFEKIIRWAVPFTIGFLIGIIIATLRLEYVSETYRVPLLHVSQGAAMMVLAVAYVRWEIGSYGAIFSPPDWIDACLFAVPFLIGLARVIGGMIDVWSHSFRFLPVLIAMARIAIAVMLYRYGVQYLAEHFAIRVPFVVVMAPALWLFVTGIARLMVVSGLVYALSFIGARSFIRLRRGMRKEKPIYGVLTITRK